MRPTLTTRRQRGHGHRQPRLADLSRVQLTSTPALSAPWWAVEPLAWIATPSIRSIAPTLGVVFAALLGAALVAHGTAFLLWDVPLQQLTESAHTPPLDRVMLFVSRLGSTPVVIAGTVVLAVAAARPSRAVAFAVLLAAGTRPIV